MTNASVLVRCRVSSSAGVILGWERQFTLDWSVEPAPHQTNRIAGYVINHSGHDVDHMRVLAQGLTRRAPSPASGWPGSSEGDYDTIVR